MQNPDKSAIENLAYRLWEQAGKPEGRDQEFYHQAERQLAGDKGVTDRPEDRLE
jgi:hypothetical protein